jgi:hypothetical protein
MLGAFAEEAKNNASLISGVAAIVSAIAWPMLILAILIWFRKPISGLAQAAVEIAQSASKVKIWQIEFDRDVQQELETSASEALKTPLDARITSDGADAAVRASELKAASRVNSLITEAPTYAVRGNLLDSIREKMNALAQEYDATRASMSPGPERTRVLDVIAAKMRTLGLAALPFLDEFSKDLSSPGRRLAAICILQMAPDLRYVSWLCERVSVEQPFVFFHASIALLNAVRRYGSTNGDALRQPIESALQKLKSFQGIPDASTVDTLTNALSELDSMRT